MGRITSIISSATTLPSSKQLKRTRDSFSALANAVFLYWIWRYVCVEAYRYIRAKGLVGVGSDGVGSVKKFVVSLLLRLPSSRAKLAKELAQTRQQLELKLVPLQESLPEGLKYQATMPLEGKNADWLKEEMERLRSMEKRDVQEGRVSGAVYHGGDEINQVIIDATSKFIVSNPLHPDVFPGIRKMEAEIVSMCLNLFNNPHGAGTTTSGGTESILMACQAYRDWARATKGITRPEMIIPASAHAAFWKASDYFGIKLHVVPVHKVSRKADVQRIARAINPNTIMLVGSAPNFPDGAVDPITDLAKLAKKYGLGLHVDCCLGSFLMPFLKRVDRDLPEFDFSVDGVTSISCDTHKYGFCPKGSSVIMYKNSDLRKYQYYIQPDWAGGVYASPSMAGSRPGSIIAGAWAVMTHLGQSGYAQSCETIIAAARHLKLALHQDPVLSADLYVLGDPLVSVVAFGSDSVNIYAVGDAMGKKGWHLNALAEPAALHLAVTMPTARNIDNLLKDLKDVLVEVKNSPAASGDMVALYGVGQTSVGPTVVTQLAEAFIDTLYMTR
ncbi:Dihydrosphingosine phosphate lyase [Naganishia albida]|nr:Dihydrosphingosine phosphate lyase [Naganishia albida]